MSRLMYITSRITEPPAGGRALLSRLHRNCLGALLGDDLVVQELDRAPVAGAGGVFQAFRGYFDGVAPQAEQAISSRIAREGIDRVFLDGSNLGRLAMSIAKAHRHVEILTFFHNVEARFFFGAFRDRKDPHRLGVLIANYLAERRAVRFSHRLVALSARESEGLERLYGRGATDILPMAMEDQLEPGTEADTKPPGEPYLLFVGGSFYANRSGIAWFVDNVAPHIAMRTVIIGHGMDSMQPRLERAGRITVVGAVPRLQDWYRHASAVVAPIFEGSGMKTKVAEALMFGKRIAGTSEAFSGYEGVAARAGWLCDDRDAFIAAVRSVETDPPPPFDSALRRIYEEHYSPDAERRRLAMILGVSE